MCDFKTNKKINNNIKHITVYCCNNFNRNILKDTINIESLEITKSGLVDFNELQIYKKLSILIVRDCSLISLPKISELENLEYLYINNIEIQCTFDISGMKKLKFISFNGSKLPNKELYIRQLQEQNPNVEVECRKEDLPIGQGVKFMFVNNFKIAEESLESEINNFENINNFNNMNNNVQLNNKFDILLNGILLEKNKIDELI